MSRRRDHHPRFTSTCPDPDGCARLYHDSIANDLVDCCECCGSVLRAEDDWTVTPENQPERCPSIDPHDTLQCGRKVHDDDRCVFGGIGWKKGTPRYVSDAEKLAELTARHDADIAAAKAAGAAEVIARVEAVADEWEPRSTPGQWSSALHPRTSVVEIRAALTTGGE